MLNLKWRRQQVIEGFIADFYCAEHHLALELDGEVHASEEAQNYDRVRDAIFAKKGIATIGIKNNECSYERLKQEIENFLSSPSSPFSVNGDVKTSPLNPLSIYGEGTLLSVEEGKGSCNAESPLSLVVMDGKGTTSPLSSVIENGEGGQGGEVWQPSAGKFNNWPDSLSQFKIIDPCCGSGLFWLSGNSRG